MEELTMKKNVFKLVVLSFGLVMMMIFASCNDGGGSSSTTPTVLYDVTGTWEVGTTGTQNLVLHLTQDGQGNITGTVDRSVASGGYDYGTIISGSNVDNTINIHATFATEHYIFDGAVTDATNMSGTITSYYEPKEQNRVYEDPFTATLNQ
jgi:hypothetical protein